MKILVIDVGGTHVKVLMSGEREPRKFGSGPTLTAKHMVDGVKKNHRRLEIRRRLDWISRPRPSLLGRGEPTTLSNQLMLSQLKAG